MEVSCPACAARYTADDDKLRGKTARMRCKACSTVWLVSGAGAVPPADVPPVSLPLENAHARPATKRAAVVKRGADREKRDLFADRQEEVIPPPSSLRSSDSSAPPPSFGFGASSRGVGARNENSVLFRVDQLAVGRVKTPEMTPAIRDASGGDRSRQSRPDAGRFGVGEDEGVIDLVALSTRNPRPLGAIGAPVAPLFSEPPPVTLEVPDHVRPNAKPTSKVAIAGGIIGGIAFLAAAIFGLAIAFRGEEPVKHTAAVVAPAPPPPPAPIVTPPPPASTADAADPSTPNASAKISKKGRGKGKGRGAAGVNASGAAPAKPKASDACGCHGDFNCILACSAKGGM